MRDYLERLARSGVGQFAAKFNADLATYGAVLIAWQSLFSLFPLILGLLALFGLFLRDPVQRQELAANVARQFPSQVTDLLGFMEETRSLGGLLGLASAVGLVWSGYWLFATMEFVFNRFYGVPDRGYVGQLVMAMTMMAVYVALITVSVLTSGLSTFLVGLGNRVLPFDIPGFALVVGWLVSLASAVLMFLAVYRFVPNAPLGVGDVWRGAVLAGVLFLLISQAFPLYLRFFGGTFTAYATLGLFLLLMTWFYFLALILVLGAELNAFLHGRRASAEPDAVPEAGRVGLWRP